MFSQVAQVNCFSGILIAIGATYLIFLTISLFISTLRDPMAVIVGQGMIFKGAIREDSNNLQEQW